MGYYAEYFSTIVKGPWALAIKERWDSKRLVRYSAQADKLIYETLPKKVEIEHKVSSALVDSNKALDAINEVVKYGLHLAFNASFEEEIIFRTIKHLIENMEKFHEVMTRIRGHSTIGTEIRDQNMVVQMEHELEKLSQKFAVIIMTQVRKAEKMEREEMKDVMTLIQQSHTMDAETFMTAVRNRFKSIKNQTRLASLAFRFDIRHEKRLISALERLSVKLEEQKKLFERILNNLNSRYRELPNVVEKFKQIVEKSEEDIEGAFKASHQIKKRDFSLMLTMLVNAQVVKQLNIKWVRMHFLPALPAQQINVRIESLERRLGEKIHVVAQALRISINAEEDLAKRALPLSRT